MNRRQLFKSLLGGIVAKPLSKLVPRASTKIGETLNIRKPARFVAEDGLSIKLVRTYDVSKGMMITRMDVLDGFTGPKYPEHKLPLDRYMYPVEIKG